MTAEDRFLVNRYKQGSEEAAKSLIDKYQQRIFALVLYLAGNDRDKAYEIAASSFMEAIRSRPFLKDKKSFLIRLVGVAVEKSRNIKIIPSSDDSDFAELPAEKRKLLRIIKTALQALSFNEKAILLLRDQLHLPYRDIAAILQISESNARTLIIHGRVRLRKKIEEALHGAG